jgi:hypothetical protein
LTETKRFNINTRRKNNEISIKRSERTSSELETTECKRRYYDEMSEELKQKKEKLLKHVQILKNIHAIQLNVSKNSIITEQNTIKIVRDSENCEQNLEIMPSRSKPPIGPLPAYIPIN